MAAAGEIVTATARPLDAGGQLWFGSGLGAGRAEEDYRLIFFSRARARRERDVRGGVNWVSPKAAPLRGRPGWTGSLGSGETAARVRRLSWLASCLFFLLQLVRANLINQWVRRCSRLPLW